MRITPFVLSFSLLAGGLLSAPIQGWAQNTTDEKAVKAVIEQYTGAYNDLPETRDMSPMLSLISPKVASSIYYFGISGQYRVFQSDLEGLKQHLEKLLRTEGLTLNYNLVEIPWIYINGEKAGATYVVDYEVIEPEGIWVKGRESVTMGLRKTGDQWKIVRLTVLGFDDERLKGTCLCEIFLPEHQAGEVITKTTVPGGQSYTTHFNSFSFTGSGEGFIIRSDSNTFTWDRTDNEIMVSFADGRKDQPIGKAANRREIVLKIIEEYLYPNSCSSLKTR